METVFPITTSVSLDPIPLNNQVQEMNVYVVAPGKEEIIDKQKYIAEIQNERGTSERNPYPSDDQGKNSIFFFIFGFRTVLVKSIISIF